MEFKIEVNHIKRLLFGGSFDPPHFGHEQCAQKVLESCPQAYLDVIPAEIPGSSTHLSKIPVASFRKRLKLCEGLFLKSSNSERIFVNDIEHYLPQPNYSYQTLVLMGKKFSSGEVGLVIGEDQFIHFDRWQRPLDILKHGPVFILNRESKPGEVLEKFQMVFQRLQCPFKMIDSKTVQLIGVKHKLYWLDNSLHSAKSSIIRKRLAQKEAPPQGWMPESIEKEIIEANLYL